MCEVLEGWGPAGAGGGVVRVTRGWSLSQLAFRSPNTDFVVLHVEHIPSPKGGILGSLTESQEIPCGVVLGDRVWGQFVTQP